MVGTSGSRGGLDPSGRAIEEARRTIDYQHRTLADIDTKASRLLRINLLVVGLLLTGVSISAGRSSPPLGAFLNGFTFLGIASLLASTILAGITYTATTLRIGVDADTVRQILSEDLSDGQIDRGLAKSYANWIEGNRRESRTNARFVSATIATATYGITLLVAGGSAAVSALPGETFVAPVLVVGLLIAGGMEWQRIRRWFQ